MAQHDFDIANQLFPDTRPDINNALAALATLNSGSSAPSTTLAYMLWADTANAVLKRRNSGNSAWLLFLTLSDTLVDTKTGTASLVVSDHGKFIICNSASNFTLTLPGASTVGAGWRASVYNIGAGTVTIQRSGSDTIDGTSSIALTTSKMSEVWCASSSAFYSRGFASSSSSYADLSAENIFLIDQHIQSSDAGAGVGPILYMDRFSASPAANDLNGALYFRGKDSAAATTIYNQIISKILDHTAGSTDSELQIYSRVAGTLGLEATFGKGLYLGSVSGGGKGTGTINVEDYYRDGTLLAFPSVYTSPDTSFSDGDILSFTHGLGAAPDDVVVKLVCTSDDAGYIAGEVLLLDGTGTQGNNSRGHVVKITSTVVTVHIGSGGLEVIQGSSDTNTTLNDSKWQFRVIARRWV